MSRRSAKQPTKADVVREEYLGDRESGLASSIRDSLKSLFAEPRLPDNPYYYLANVLGAYVDQNDLWKQFDLSVVSVFDNEGGVEVTDSVAKICKLTSCTQSWGLPHVLRVVSRDGVKVLHDVLTNSLPDAFFPGPMPYSSGDGYTIQSLCSVQGVTAIWRPQWLEFPELMVRADVLIRGTKVDEALGHFVDLLVSDVRELAAIPVYFVTGITIQDSLSAKANGDKARADQHFSLEDIETKADEFRKTVQRGVLAGKLALLKVVVMLDAPQNAAKLEERSLRFEMGSKMYSFHFIATQDPSQAAPAMVGTKSHVPETSHFCSGPYEALYEGYFLDPVAAKQYCALFTSSHKDPYSQQALEQNLEQLMNLVEVDMLSGGTLEGFRRTLLLILLQDAVLTKPGPLRQAAIEPLEQLVVLKQRITERDMLLSVVPNLLRILNSGASEIESVVREIEALSFVGANWPARKQLFISTVLNEEHQSSRYSSQQQHLATGKITSAIFPDGVTGVAADLIDATPETTLTWLQHVNMEGKVLQQLLELKPRIQASTGNGIFSGISSILEVLTAQLPNDVPPSADTCQQLISSIHGTMVSTQQLLAAAALTLADGLLDRCRDVMWALHRLGIQLVDSVMARESAITEEGDFWVVPEWVMNVQSVKDAQVRCGAVAERVAIEGVMLQYAVDTKLDELLSTIYASLTEPPLVINPYPRLMHYIRAHAARLDLWRDDVEEGCYMLLNQLMLLRPPAFIYAALPSHPASGRSVHTRKRLMGAGGAGAMADDDDECAVYGCYSAVMTSDCRAIQALCISLGSLISGCHWQQGAYSFDVVPALLGDACYSAALKLDDDESWNSNEAHTDKNNLNSARPPYEHPRFYHVEVEEHYLAVGPKRKEAAVLFATNVLEGAVSLHNSSLHLLHQLDVRDATFILQDVITDTSKQAAISKIVDTIKHQVQDQTIATLHISAAVKEGIYVRITKRLLFQHRTMPAPLNESGVAAAAHRSRPANEVSQVTADAPEPHWPVEAYQRVFMCEAHALQWYGWNQQRGDPAQPYQYHHLVTQLQKQVLSFERSGNYLEAQKLLLLCGIAMQDVDVLFHLSRALHSAAQELHCLQVINKTLVDIMTTTCPEQRAKIDNERVRKLFLLYCARLRRAMTSPKYCYFSGFAAVAPKLLTALKEEVLSNFRLTPAFAAIMQQLNLWTRCCEFSVAGSIHDCFDASIKHELEQRLHGTESAFGAAG